MSRGDPEAGSGGALKAGGQSNLQPVRAKPDHAEPARGSMAGGGRRGHGQLTLTDPHGAAEGERPGQPGGSLPTPPDDAFKPGDRGERTRRRSCGTVLGAIQAHCQSRSKERATELLPLPDSLEVLQRTYPRLRRRPGRSQRRFGATRGFNLLSRAEWM